MTSASVGCGETYHWMHCIAQTLDPRDGDECMDFFWCARCAARREDVPLWVILQAARTNAVSSRDMARAQSFLTAINTPWYDMAMISTGYHETALYTVEPDAEPSV